ncbi:hypothetical protein CDV31_006731 [Fusarium ambrosium]|uniref:Inner centromere protein ARK-binding domain-containing protein n=1 Tax=Fusarium ambrosium TaxID=131363 RepID=A0A428UB80_9HYPO|nr:hypothetical protein CDV31_006731 [Fusarium ambrosium]
MAAMRGPRIPTGSAAWVADERASALQIVDVEVDEFTYAAHNEFSWLNEHMAGIFSENETNIAETFKTPGKLRGKTPRTVRKLITAEPRVPLSDVFGGTPSSSANRLAHHLRAHSPQLQKESSIPPPSPSPRRHAPSPPKPTLPSPEKTFRIAQEDQTVNHVEHISSDNHVEEPAEQEKEPAAAAKSQPMTQDSGYYGSQDINSTDADPLAEEEASLIDPTTIDEPVAVPAESSPLRSIVHDEPVATSPAKTQQTTTEPQQPEEASPDDARSQSDGSSPIRPGFRKSSLNFPSLPAREPLAAGKSGGPRASRTSHLDFKRTSYFGRHTGGKSLGNHARQDASDEEDHDEMDVDDVPSVPAQQRDNAEDLAVHHNKTYTQMLQDRINVLGKSQPSRPSKSIHSLTNSQAAPASQPALEPKSPSPKKLETATTPGAFPEDDDDDWIDPPAAEPASETESASRPTLSKSHSADVMEGIHGKETVGSLGDLDIEERAKTQSPTRAAANLQRPNILGHGKSISVPAVPLVSSLERQDASPHKKTVSVSNPSAMMATVAESGVSQTPTKSPSRRFRDSPLKQVKNKLSSVLTMSKGLLISSAAVSAEGKSSILSPSTTRLGLYPNLSSESALRKPSADSLRNASPVAERHASPTRPVAKRTRASTEREKEDKRREKEAKFQAEQMDKLEKEREKEREKVRVFSKEQERIAIMEKQLAAKKESEPPATKTTPKATRSSPRKAKPYETETKAADHDMDMVDAPAMAPPPSASRSVGPGQPLRNKELRRPMKPGKETLAKTKQAPTVIRVNTGSQHSQFHPASSSMSASFQDHGASTSSQPKQQLASKASKASLQTKSSVPALNASVGSTGRPRALDLAAKKKEQDDREAQRRRDAKAEMDRKRAAAKEEKKRQEQLQRQAEEQRKREQADAKKNAQRQAAIEKAKKTPAPPPAVRSQPNGPPDYSLGLDKSSSVQRGDGPPRPPSRMNSGIHRSQEDIGRPVNAVLSTASKSKRPLGQDANEDGPARHAPSRGPQYQAKDAKRRRTSDEFADELDFDQPPNIKGPPLRPSSTLKKDMQTKNMMSGYVSQNTVQTLFKTGVAQHPGQAKGGNPLDMAQIHKGAIPFAPNPNPAGPSYKTPARLGGVNGAKSTAKSAQRSSPRFQNGEAVELPEIQTDDEDEDDDDGPALTVAAWADSPDLRRALMRQEVMDPSHIFGLTAPVNMEEVFNQSKERFHKFRARTSSANWSGTDRLTEDDIRKDLAARDKLRREGGWSYELSRDMM